MIQAVADGQFDVGADGITITDDRLKQVDFSDGYIQIEQKLLVRKGEDRFDSMQALVDNPDLLLAVQSNTTNYETATQYLPETRINAFEQIPFAVQAVIAGDADAVLMDAIVGMGYMGQSSDQLALLDEAISSDELGFAFKKGSDLVIPVNRALESMRADGTLKALNEKYFGPDFKMTEDDIQVGE
jgi:polar amino acid transport system substrate-binding protein